MSVEKFIPQELRDALARIEERQRPLSETKTIDQIENDHRAAMHQAELDNLSTPKVSTD